MTELVHYGVKGMHWGVRKAELPTHKSYSQRKQTLDRQTYGKQGVKRINKRLHKGKTYKQAKRREFGLYMGKAVLTSGIASTIVILDLYGKHPATFTAQRAETKRGQAAAANAMGLPRKPTNGPTYSKKSRQGVHKITTL